MAINYNPKIILDGLVLYLDAANTKSYPGSGTTWTDLSGLGNTGTLTNGPTYSSVDNGSIVFDGVDDYVQVTGSITTSSASFIVWLKRNGDQTAYDGLLFSRGTSVTGLHIGPTTNQIGYTWNDAAATYTWNSGLTIPNLSWCMCVLSVSASSATVYLCQSSGITSAVNTTSHTSTVLDDINVGRDDNPGGGRLFNGNIAQASIYNRALTAAEIQQNFNALRGRFGI